MQGHRLGPRHISEMQGGAGRVGIETGDYVCHPQIVQGP